MSASATRVDLLLTGFGPFPGVARNPSAELVDWLGRKWRDGAGPAGVSIETCVLPTEYAAVDRWIAGRLLPVPPRVLLMTGYSSVADRLKIEKRATNVCAPELPDASGASPAAGRKDLRERDSTLPVAAISQALEEAGVPHMLSNDCGRYVCNHVFFRAQQALAQDFAESVSGFLHLPPVDFRDGRILPPYPGRARPAEELARAIEIVADCALAGGKRRQPAAAGDREASICSSVATARSTVTGFDRQTTSAKRSEKGAVSL